MSRTLKILAWTIGALVVLPLLLITLERLAEPRDDTVDDRPHLDRTTEQPRHRGHPAIADTARRS